MARIGFLLTRTPWYDRRQYHRQGPALLAEGHTVVYLASVPKTDLDYAYQPVPLSATERKLAGLTGGLNLLPKIVRARLDVLQICSVELLVLGLVTKTLRITKVVYDCREDMPSAMRDHKTWFPWPVRIVLSFMTRVLESAGDRLFDGLVTADPATAELHDRMARERKVVFYNVAPIKHFPIDGPDLAERTYDLGIIGSMSARTGALDVIRAVARLRERGRRLKVLILGKETGGPFQDAMKALMAETGVSDQFHWRGPVDHLEVPKLLYDMRIGVVSWHDYPKFRHNIAAKALEFIAARAVTVATDLPSQRVFLKPGSNAVLYPPGDIDALARALGPLLDDLESAQKLADQGRRDFIDTWNLDRMKVPYTELFDRLTRERREAVMGSAGSHG